MTVMAVMPRATDDWTVDDLEQLPDDGLQYELLDGILLVSPAPIPPANSAMTAVNIVSSPPRRSRR